MYAGIGLLMLPFLVACASSDGTVSMGSGIKSSSSSSSSSLGRGYGGSGSLRFFLLYFILRQGDDRTGSILSAIMYKKTVSVCFAKMMIGSAM